MVEDDDDLRAVEHELSMPAFVSFPENEDEEEAPSPTDEIETTFDPRHREPFVGLLYLGQLKTEVTKYGHSFDLVTPSQRDRLEGGILHKKFMNSLSGEIGWAAIVVGLYLRAVDGQSLPEPIGPSAQTQVAERFNWVIDNIKGPLITELFEECLLLDAQVRETLGELERLGN